MASTATVPTHATLDVPVESGVLADILLRGSTTYEGALRIALPSRLVELDGERRVRFDLVEPAAVERPPSIAVWLRASRAVSLTATITPCIAVLLYGLAVHFPVRPLVAFTSIIGALVLQLSVNLWNDVEDHCRLIDMPGTSGGAGVIQKGWLSALQVKRAAVGCLVLGLLLGVPALLAAPMPLLVIGALAAIGTLGYSGKPFGFKYIALGDLTVFALCGPALTLGFAYAAFGTVDAVVVALGFYFGLAAVGILHVNNWQDVDADRKSGARTVAGLLGMTGSKVYLVLLYAGALAAWAWAWSQSSLPVVALLAPLLAVIPLAKLLRAVLGAGDPGAPHLAMVRVQAAQLHLFLGVALCIGLGVACLMR